MLEFLNWAAVIAIVLVVLWLVTLAEIAARRGRTGGGYSAKEDMPPGTLPPRESGILPPTKPGS